MAVEAIADAGIQGAELTGDRDRQPARDGRRLGPGDRRAGPSSAGLAGPPHRRALRRAARRGPRGAGPRAHRPRPRPLLLRHQDRVAAAQRRGGRAGGVRHGRLLAAVQADRPPRDRLHERLADDAVRHPPARLGRGAAASCSASTRRGCPSRCPPPTSTGRPRSSAARCRSPGSPATSRRRCSARPASSPARRRTPTGPAASSCSTPATEAPEPAEGLLTTVACAPRRGGRLRARGLDLRHRRRRAVAARRARDHRRGGGERGAGRLARGQRRRLLRPGADRARLAPLGPLRARHDRRPHPRQRSRPPGAGGAGGDRLPDRRRGAGRGGGLRRGGWAS